MSLDAESFNHERDDLERSDTRTTGTPGGSKPAVSAVGNERKRLYEQDLNPGDFKKVRAKSRCDHGDARTAAGPPSASKAAEKTNQCKERDGFAVCQHSRIKNRCKDCGGSPKRKDRSWTNNNNKLVKKSLKLYIIYKFCSWLRAIRDAVSTERGMLTNPLIHLIHPNAYDFSFWFIGLIFRNFTPIQFCLQGVSLEMKYLFVYHLVLLKSNICLCEHVGSNILDCLIIQRVRIPIFFHSSVIATP
jgi:hypothetical protein